MYKTTIPTVVTNGHFNREKTLREIKRCGAERIAIAIDREVGHAFSSPENLKLIKELIAYYKENGLKTLVWLGETFGHDGSPAKENSPYTNIRFIDKGDINSFCPMDKNFLDDFCTWVKNIAKCGADMIMTDDDFRQGYRGGLGCCCDLHMAELEKALGEKIKPEELREKLFSGGKNKYRDAWMKVQRDSLYNFAKALRKAIDEVNPDVRLGGCMSPGIWDSEGTDVYELSKIFAGNTKPFFRTIGAPYWKTYKLGEIVEFERNQFHWCKDFDAEFFSEGDTYPRPRFETPASYLECFDMILRADGGSDGILKYSLDYVSDADYETGYIDSAVDNQEIYTQIDKYFKDKKAIGIRPYNTIHHLENIELNPNEAGILDEVQNYIFQPSIRFCVSNSLPITYEKENVNVIFGENARYIPLDELKFGNIIDIKAAKILMKRGVDVGIECIEEKDGFSQKGFTDVPQEYFVDEDEYVRLSPFETACVKHKDGVKILTEYHTKTDKEMGAFEYENADGMRFLVYPFDALKAKQVQAQGWFDSYSRRRQVVKSLEWLSGKAFPIAPDGNYPRLHILAKENDEEVAVGLWNLFEDKIKNARIKAAYKGKVKFINCEGHVENDVVVLDNILYPYEFAGFVIEK